MRVGDEIVFSSTEVTTRPQIGVAQRLTVDVPAGEVVLTSRWRRVAWRPTSRSRCVTARTSASPSSETRWSTARQVSPSATPDRVLVAPAATRRSDMSQTIDDALTADAAMERRGRRRAAPAAVAPGRGQWPLPGPLADAPPRPRTTEASRRGGWATADEDSGGRGRARLGATCRSASAGSSASTSTAATRRWWRAARLRAACSSGSTGSPGSPGRPADLGGVDLLPRRRRARPAPTPTSASPSCAPALPSPPTAAIVRFTGGGTSGLTMALRLPVAASPTRSSSSTTPPPACRP